MTPLLLCDGQCTVTGEARQLYIQRVRREDAFLLTLTDRPRREPYVGEVVAQIVLTRAELYKLAREAAVFGTFAGLQEDDASDASDARDSQPSHAHLRVLK